MTLYQALCHGRELYNQARLVYIVPMNTATQTKGQTMACIMQKINFGLDPSGVHKIYSTSCMDCDTFIRLQSEYARQPDGTPTPPPDSTVVEYRCSRCGFAHVKEELKTDH